MLKIINVIMSILCALCVLAIPVLIIIFIVRWIMKKKKNRIGLSTLFCFLGVIITALIGSQADLYSMSPEERVAYYEKLKQEEEQREAKKAAKKKEEEKENKDNSSKKTTVSKEDKTETTSSKVAVESKKETSAPKEDKKDDSYFKADDTQKGKVADVDTTLVTTLTEAGYSLEHATKIAEILNGVGIESIKIDAMTGEPEKGLNAVMCYPNGATERDKRFRFTTEDGVVFNAGFLGEDLYDTEKGGYFKKYADVHIPEKTVDMETYTTLQIMAETEVKKYLNYPSTADFGMLNWGVGRSDDNYKIIGIVTAQNVFGVEDEISFSVWFKQTSNGFTVEGVALDGQRVK